MQIDFAAVFQLFFCICIACFTGFHAFRLGIWTPLGVLGVSLGVFTLCGIYEFTQYMLQPLFARASERKAERLNAEFDQRHGIVHEGYRRGSIVDKRI